MFQRVGHRINTSQEIKNPDTDGPENSQWKIGRGHIQTRDVGMT
jgi:hypothetical protein